jgi:hypothetical protein
MNIFNKSLLVAGLLFATSFSAQAADALKAKLQTGKERIFPASKNTFNIGSSLSEKAAKWQQLASEWNMTVDEVRTFVKSNAGGDKTLESALNAYLDFNSNIINGIKEYFKLPETRVEKAKFGIYLNENHLGYQDENGLATLEAQNALLNKTTYFMPGKSKSRQVLLALSDVLAQIINKVHKDYNADVQKYPVSK